MISFERECFFSLPGYAVSADCLAAKAAFPERIFGKLLSFDQSCCGHGRSFFQALSRNKSHRHEAQCSCLSVKASASDSDSQHGNRPRELLSKVASSKKKSKSSKQKLVRERKEQNPLLEPHNKEDLHPELETAVLNPNVLMIGGLQEEDEDSGSWMDDDKYLLAMALNKLEALHLHALALEQWHGSWLSSVHRKYQKSAQNLLHYMAIKSVDLEEVQSSLPTLGLASIEGAEGHVVASLSRTIGAARALVRSLADTDAGTEDRLFLKHKEEGETNFLQDAVAHDVLTPISIGRSKLLLNHNTITLFGPRTSQRKTYIMVTLSEEVIQNEDAVLELMKAGMDIARINCAHGNPEAWGSVIQTVRHCSQMLEQPCRVLMDLAGPKLRTSAFPPGPCVQKIRPHRDGLGNVTLPARV
ncbi:hypothetical protein L7F22_062673 [Adiantum nelumboides]|nr:hypothetical protein [Adiantum nelumboides]